MHSGGGIGVSGNAPSGAGVWGDSITGHGVRGVVHEQGVGVLGVATRNVGVWASAPRITGTALAIESGAIQVIGAGVGTQTAAWIFEAPADGPDFALDHPMCNGDPRAILFVMPMANPKTEVPQGVGVGVSYDGNDIDPQPGDRWHLIVTCGGSIFRGQRFNILIIKS